jgi:hypothetical protein
MTLTQARRSAQFQRYALVKLTTWDGTIEYYSAAYPWHDTAHGLSQRGEVHVIEDYREEVTQ